MEDKPFDLAFRLSLARARNLAIIRKQKTRREAEHEACPHMKPAGAGSSLVGVHTGRGTAYLCQYCQKEWTENDSVPVHLIPRTEAIGSSIPSAHGTAEVSVDFLQRTERVASLYKKYEEAQAVMLSAAIQLEMEVPQTLAAEAIEIKWNK